MTNLESLRMALELQLDLLETSGRPWSINQAHAWDLMRADLEAALAQDEEQVWQALDMAAITERNARQNAESRDDDDQNETADAHSENASGFFSDRPETDAVTIERHVRFEDRPRTKDGVGGQNTMFQVVRVESLSATFAPRPGLQLVASVQTVGDLVVRWQTTSMEMQTGLELGLRSINTDVLNVHIARRGSGLTLVDVKVA
ncbi:MAG: hypothetical protein Q9227_009156 [Pyrenula ochraceoflavens]